MQSHVLASFFSCSMTWHGIINRMTKTSNAIHIWKPCNIKSDMLPDITVLGLRMTMHFWKTCFTDTDQQKPGKLATLFKLRAYVVKIQG